MAQCTTRCTRYKKKWEQRGKTPCICFALSQSPSVHRNKHVLQKTLGEHVSLEMQRNTTSSPLPLPLPPLHARRWWQCLADTLSVSTPDDKEGSSRGMAEVRDLITLGLEKQEAPLRAYLNLAAIVHVSFLLFFCFSLPQSVPSRF